MVRLLARASFADVVEPSCTVVEESTGADDRNRTTRTLTVRTEVDQHGDEFRAHQAEGDGGSGDPDGSALTEGPALDGAPSDGVGVGDSSASPGTNV